MRQKYDLEIYVIIIFVNHPKIVTCQKLSCPLSLFGLKSFHRLVIFTRWKDGAYCLSSVSFGHKNGSF